jgi:hypothetical protein
LQVSIQLAQDRPTITRIDAITPGSATIKGINVEKRAITVSVGGHEWTAVLTADVTVVIQGKQDAQFSDLSAGMAAFLELGVDGDKFVAKSIMARGE